jgi:antitoxin (DNA-binding transcriptional repressor) of toxin-antitoxin stability system
VARYSIAEAREVLPALVDKALAGEEVTLTRDGEAVVELRPAAERAHRRPSREFIEQLAERARSRPRLGENAVDIIRRIRDGERD